MGNNVIAVPFGPAFIHTDREKGSLDVVNTNKCPTPKGIITVSFEKRRKPKFASSTIL
jgi:hypothetical protein